MKMKQINVGKSGAEVFDVDGEHILKRVTRGKVSDDLFDTYSREALFYQNKKGREYLPEIESCELTDKEISILMKRYEQPSKEATDNELIHKIARAICLVHTDDIPDFLKISKNSAEEISAEKAEECINGWKSVLTEHPGAFDAGILEKIAESLNDIIKWHDSEEQVLTHGDFHWDNLLTDESGAILICDWQGVKAGGASEDLSFFISRLGADDVRLNRTEFLEAYAEEMGRLSGKRVDVNSIVRHMAAANVITSFLFWHYYLHDNPEDRVREVYEKMVKDYKEVF